MNADKTRRDFLKTTSLVAGSIAAAGRVAFAKDAGAVVADTANGKIRGVDLNGIKLFRGIPYGGSTAGKNRFMPPTKVAKWSGVRDGSEWGHISPQTLVKNPGDYEKTIEWDKERGGLGEDCLNLNIWTPAVKDGVKRTVMVSYHGGGFTTGSGNLGVYDGEAMARFGNVVVVTVNHRLGALGYTDLSGLGGPEFAYSGVAGMMDCVASLEWVRDNIESFGGNPKSVMIFGQSGGGAKTSTVLAMPSAKGLFHSAGVQSGSTIRSATREAGTKAAEALLAKLGIAKGNIADIQKVSWQQILEAQTSAGAAFSPVVDGTVIPHHPFDPTGPPESADVPVIISTTLEDAALALTNFDLTEDGLHKMMNERYGEKADGMVALYRDRYPSKTPYLIQAQIGTDAGGRRNAILQGERKAAMGKAPGYMYLWEYASPGFDGKFGAVHGTDVSASFYNFRDGVGGTGSRKERALWGTFASAWVSLAKTGNPNNPKTPHWPAYDEAKRATMVFDNETRVENDPRAEMRKFWQDQPARRG